MKIHVVRLSLYEANTIVDRLVFNLCNTEYLKTQTSACDEFLAPDKVFLFEKILFFLEMQQKYFFVLWCKVDINRTKNLPLTSFLASILQKNAKTRRQF